MNKAMRLLPLFLAAIQVLLASTTITAGEIREFDVKTTERLGNELVRVSKRADRGFTTPAKKQAKETAIAAVSDRLYDQVRYDYAVLDDPAGSGFLVYALAIQKKKGGITTGGHYRVTTSADGTVAKRVDLLSQLIEQPEPAAGNSFAALVIAQVEAQRPVETWIYTSDLYHLPIFIATMDKSFWRIANGTIHKFTKAELEKLESAGKKK